MEGTKDSERGEGRAFGQTGILRQGSEWSPRKIGEGDIEECFARDGMGWSAREATTHRKEEVEPNRRQEEGFGSQLSQGVGSGCYH